MFHVKHINVCRALEVFPSRMEASLNLEVSKHEYICPKTTGENRGRIEAGTKQHEARKLAGKGLLY